MSYTEIQVHVKKAVVRQCWAGGKIAEISREYGVSRRSVYYWLEIADAGLEDVLKDEFDPTKQSSILAKLQRENAELRHEIVGMRNSIDALSQNSQLRISVKSPKHEIRPGLCLKCRNDEVLKNGKYRVKDTERDDVIEGTEFVQRFICKQCGTRVYLAGKKGR